MAGESSLHTGPLVPLTKERYPPKRSISDGDVTKGSMHNNTMPNRRIHVSLLPLRPTTQRAASSSWVELRPRCHDPAPMSPALQCELFTQVEHFGNHLSGSPHGSFIETEHDQYEDLCVKNLAPSMQQYAHVRSNSNPDLRSGSANSTKQNVNGSLKTCLKKKAKSTTTSSHAGFREAANKSSEDRILRRIKTVDFGEDTQPLPILPASRAMSKKIAHLVTDEASRLPAGDFMSKKNTHKTFACSNKISAAKSSLADPAITRTDIHVIAIAPSRNVEHVANQDTVDPATPTMQIIESNNGCYEVVWDEVPSEHNICTKRRSSSASHSLIAAGSTSPQSLQRVNSKLTDWSGTWNAHSETFKPTIVVFPDEDGRTTHFESAMNDQEDAHVPVPPCSQRTSAAPSRLPSRPVSAPFTRAASQEHLKLEDTLQETTPSMEWIVPTLVAPDPEATSIRGTKQLPAFRRLSNVQDDELKFRGHRDSVTLTRSRLVRSGAVAPELFAHRDLVAWARKRMHARNHAVSAAHEILVPKAGNALVEELDDGDDGEILHPRA
jgi:hypothetical protein